VAYSGTEGWSLFQQIKPDIAVLDLMLPGIDGFELLEKIRSVDEEVGVVVLTARGEVENRIRGLKKGADDYIPKPFHLDELLAKNRLDRNWRCGVQQRCENSYFSRW